jgi:hypothetical protein
MNSVVFRRMATAVRLVLGVGLLVMAGCQTPARTTSTDTAAEATAGQEAPSRQVAAAPIPAQEPAAGLKGAWRLVRTTEPGRTAPDVVKIMAGNSFTVVDYDLDQKRFIGAGGGLWAADKGRYTETLEYNTQDSTRVGSSLAYDFNLSGNALRLTTQKKGRQVEETWERIDTANSPLAGAWRIRERETQPGQMSVMQRGPRKTIKWLSGDRFQWAAINTETKQFFGTGGGIYTLDDGKYTEHIEFFSRDPQRVGASLSFDYEVKNDDWHHRGKSSAGNPIYEIWALER